MIDNGTPDFFSSSSVANGVYESVMAVIFFSKSVLWRGLLTEIA